MDSQSIDDPKPSTSTETTEENKVDEHGSQTESTQHFENDINTDRELSKVLTIEEFLLKSKTYMLEHEKHMFLDTIDSDCLVVTAKYVNF